MCDVMKTNTKSYKHVSAGCLPTVPLFFVAMHNAWYISTTRRSVVARHRRPSDSRGFSIRQHLGNWAARKRPSSAEHCYVGWREPSWTGKRAGTCKKPSLNEVQKAKPPAMVTACVSCVVVCVCYGQICVAHPLLIGWDIGICTGCNVHTTCGRALSRR